MLKIMHASIYKPHFLKIQEKNSRRKIINQVLLQQSTSKCNI